MVNIPPFPVNLNKAERRAVLFQAARDLAADAIRESGLDAAPATRDTLTADGATAITLAWLIERVDALEAAERKARKPKGATP